MTLSRRAASLLSGLLLLAVSSHAQTPLGKPTLDEQKVQVWCATARFVYEDTGRPNLKNSLQCGSSLKAFENSIKPDSQRVYSALYQPLEGRGTMYQGLGSDPSRLQKLTTEIINRLKSSPARRANPARMQRLATLETALSNYVQNGTPIGDLAAAESATSDVTDTTTNLDAGAPEVSGDAGLSEAGVAVPQAAASTGAGESLMNKFFGPLALILSLLSLVLYALMRKSLAGFQKEMSARIDRRREEISALQSAPTTGGSKPADRLTPAQLREVESLVQQRVEEEMKKIRGNQVNRASTAGHAARPVSATSSKPAPPTPPVNRPAPVAAPVQQPPAPAEPVAPAATAYSAPEPPTEVPVAPPVPASPPTASLHEDFNNLVPPVQLPAPEPYVTPTPMNHARYVKVPVNGAFNEYDLTDEPQHDSIYEIRLNPQQPETATFRVTSNSAVYAYAIQSAQYSLREACVYQQPTGPVSRIVNEKDGVLRKVAGNWQIEQKAAIRFE
ncbi:hypothetical protein KBK19_01795 [Microvirga sp. STR05]|uniref:WG repeat-containing protein n=1 Tax=Hymenobacter duratus TaxID=2771356 RepID=A0ABR8JEH9_9BACT|nr:hypothetical protein [Hymenobacter duratus]MBD2713762.1 hypothetical protein [Hymenobacter duratus]MBR7948664.1 hypothetical protein [Microvirga sp. STR05]